MTPATSHIMLCGADEATANIKLCGPDEATAHIKLCGDMELWLRHGRVSERDDEPTWRMYEDTFGTRWYFDERFNAADMPIAMVQQSVMGVTQWESELIGTQIRMDDEADWSASVIANFVLEREPDDATLWFITVDLRYEGQPPHAQQRIDKVVASTLPYGMYSYARAPTEEDPNGEYMDVEIYEATS